MTYPWLKAQKSLWLWNYTTINLAVLVLTVAKVYNDESGVMHYPLEKSVYKSS